MPRRAKQSNDIQRQLGDTATPLYVLDDERRVRVFNAGCEALTGWTAAEMLGQLCWYGSDSPDAVGPALSGNLCPPPEAFAGEELSVPAFLAHRNGEPVARVIHFFPLRDTDEHVTGVLGLIMPIQPPTTGAPESPARRLHAELASLRIALRNRFGVDTLLGQCPPMITVQSQIELARQVPAFVMIEGESGTGKEHAARVIHFGSPAKANWFVPLDCRRLDAAELGRVLDRLLEVHGGRAVLGGGSPQPGTIYLADVDYLPRDLQERIAAAFSQPEAVRRPRLRIISSTSGSFRQAVDEEKIRTDFAAIVSTLTIHMPPLRERGADAQLLAQHFLEEVNRQGSKQVGGFDEQVWPLFTQYRWPANLDELQNVIRESHERASESLIRPQDLPFRFRTALEAQSLARPAEARQLPLDQLLTRVETQLISLALERTKNNKSKAAELLGINRARLLARIERLGLGKPEESARENSEQPSETPEP